MKYSTGDPSADGHQVNHTACAVEGNYRKTLLFY